MNIEKTCSKEALTDKMWSYFTILLDSVRNNDEYARLRCDDPDEHEKGCNCLYSLAHKVELEYYCHYYGRHNQ